MADERYDVIIIGTGAGGGTLAHRLAGTGKRVLLLERGGWLPRERDNWDSTAVFVEGKYRAPEFWLDRHGHEFPPEVNYYVGGNTKFYGAALFRLRPEDFGELRHFGGLSPAWPVGYDEFEPYYTQAEHLYRVHGQHGEDPTEGPASQQYLHPPVQHEPRIQQLSDDLEKQGLHPFHLPIGVDLLQDPDGSVSSRRTLAWVSSVTFGCSSAGSTHTTCASDFAPTRQGKPSTRSQRMHRLARVARPASSCTRSTPMGRWNGCSPCFSRSSESCWIRGSCCTGGWRYCCEAAPSVGSSPCWPCTR